MGKKRERDEQNPAHDGDKMDEDDSEDDFDVVNVDFEWFNFDADIDFHGTKALLRQLFDVDAVKFNISGLADLVISQPTIGSTVKVDDKANDAYALMTVLNMHEHRDKPAFADLTKYIIEKAQTNEALAPIPQLLTSGAQVGLVLTERLINMPTEIAPPMYRMLIDEIEAAVEDKEPYEFTHYLVLSKTYREVEPEAELRTERKGKKQKGEDGSMWYFHPEDEVTAKHAVAHGAYSYSHENEGSAESKRAFQEMGIKPQGYLMLVEASKWKGAVDAVEQYLKPQ
ncbi:Mss4p nuclear export [Verticillium nonalfalfae]|uniref:Protein BCP1 n=1 Tax=Verticillium nonalfalfae TaxID=1051616 RepID=A0A3M9YBE5_9PEZI|nr:Mss4p nuclear export [Verticillium nonalfalfae]RNJ57302.1 Mss4p nuclear export [Verticillium nonalfalfae]